MIDQENGVSQDAAAVNYGNQSVGAENQSVPFQETNSFPAPEKKSKKKVIVLAIIVVAFLILAGGGVWGFMQYSKIYKRVQIEELLPGNSNIVAKISIDPESEQFKLLESNMEKFPGYGILKKELGDHGEDKTISQIIQDEIRKKGLDFQEDIKSVISDEAYIIIPDAGPLASNIKNEAILSFAQKKKQLALSESDKGGMVLGTEDSKEKELIPTDYLIASVVKDLKKAKETLKKIVNDGKYEVIKKKFEGYQYFEVKIKDTKDEKAKDFINYETTYHALLGGNWVLSSKEDYIKNAISLKKNRGSDSAGSKKDGALSLTDDESYQRVHKSLNKAAKKGLVDVYYNLNFEKFFGKGDCEERKECSTSVAYIKYPKDFTGGVAVRMEEDGIEISNNSNQVLMKDVKNIPLESSLATKIPQRVDQKWTDVFLENNSIKSSYYNFKDNNLTEEGVKELEQIISEVEKSTGIDLEKDFIDISSGSGAFAVFTKKDDFPSAAFILEVSNSSRMDGNMRKLIELIKNSQISMYSQMIQAYSSSQFQGSPYGVQMKSKISSMNAEYAKLIEEIKGTSIKEENFPEGKVFSYSIHLPKAYEEFTSSIPTTLNYSLEDGKFIFSFDSMAIRSILKDMKGEAYESLADNSYYKEASKYYGSETYVSTYIAMQGIVNCVEYWYGKMRQMALGSNAISDQPSADNLGRTSVAEPDSALEEADDNLFAILAVIKTLNLVGARKVIENETVSSSVYFNIIQIPEDEKEKADQILERM